MRKLARVTLDHRRVVGHGDGMARIITVTANPLLDFLSDEALVPGKVTRSSGFKVMAAGKGINVARVLHKHGHSVQAAFFSGDGTGQQLSDLIADDGITPMPVATEARMRVGFITKGQSNQEQGSLLETGFTVTQAEQAALAAAVTQQLSACDMVIIGGSIPCPSAAACYVPIVAACATAGVPCWLDSYGPGMAAALEADPAPLLAKPNREELASTTLWERCPELHITDGSKPLEVHYGDDIYDVEPPPLIEVNPVGSGDCYVAGLAHARLSGLTIEQQLRYAAACGGANARRWDVAQIGPADVAGLEDDVLITKRS